MGDDPGTRGQLTIRNKAAGRIVERAALDVPGVVRSGGRLGALTGRTLPRAIVDMTPDEPNIRVDIAVQWPMPIAAVCAQVQRRVVADLVRFTDRHAARVDVSVAEVVPAGNADGVADVVAHAHSAPDNPDVPLSRPLAFHIALVVAVLSIALAVVAAREFFVDGRSPLIAPVVEWIGRMRWQQWYLPAACAVLFVGAVLVVVAIWPRRRTHFSTSGTPRLWLRSTDVARLSTAASLHVDGVRRAVTDAGRRTARVRVVTDPRNPPDAAQIEQAVDAALADLTRQPAVRVLLERPPTEAR